MKRTVLMLTLTLGFSALGASAQSQGDQARQLKESPAPKEEREISPRDRGRSPRMERRREMLRRHQLEMRRRNWQSARDHEGLPPRFGQGRPGFGPQGRGPLWNAPDERGRQLQVCPRCGRPFDRELAPVGPRRGGQVAGPRRNFGPMARGFGTGPQDRGPAFGPPPWAGRGGPNEDLRPGPRGPREDMPPTQGRRFGPMRRGFEGPANPPVPDDKDVRP